MKNIGILVIALVAIAGCSGDGATSQPAAAVAGQQYAVDEWQVPYEKSRPRDPFVDSQGRAWFCGQAGAYLAYLQPDSGSFHKYDLADGAGPHNLIIDTDDQVWFAANTLPYIGRLDPASGEVVKFPMPEPVRDPHTLVFDSAGDIWFTAQRSNYIGKLLVSTGEVKAFAVPVPASRPYGIKVDDNDRPWVVLFGTNKLATVDPQTLQLEIIDLPREETRPRRLEITADGAIWYGDYAAGMLGKFDPSTRQVQEWLMPGGSKARPYGTVLDDNGAIWLAEGSSPNRLVRFDPAAGEFTDIVELPNAQGSVRHMYFHPPTREIWFGEDSNYIGRVRR